MECTTAETISAVEVVETPVGGKREIEKVTCSRCGGCGQYSYCAMYGTRCFKCGGAGKVLTKRGAAAQDYLIGLRSAPVSSLTIGQVVKVPCGLSGKVWMRVVKMTAVENIYDHCISSFVNGVQQPVPVVPGFDIEFNKMAGKYKGDQMVRVAQTNEQLQETFRLAMDYQDSLTKAGTVKKARGKKAVVA